MSASFVRAYLIGWQLGLGLSVGCLLILMLHHLVHGRWGRAILPLLEAGARVLPIWALGLLPLVLGGAELLYPWADPELMASDDLLRHKAGYLDMAGFTARSIVCLVLWSGLVWGLTRSPGRRRPALAAAGLVVVFLSATPVYVDWLASLDPHFSSSIFALYILITNAAAGLALVLILVAARGGLPRERSLELGNLQLASLMLWGYLAFSQYLLIWSGDLPHQSAWYIARNQGPWLVLVSVYVGMALVIGLPALFVRAIKRESKRLAAVAAVLLTAHVIELYWIVLPAEAAPGATLPTFGSLDALIPAGLGATWLVLTLALLRRRERVHAPTKPAEVDDG
jgi:hypothetical protein